MTYEEVEKAAKLWNLGLDTYAIAKALQKTEAVIVANIQLIRLTARDKCQVLQLIRQI